jgi:GNAT superfamily N-acetyltransferase
MGTNCAIDIGPLDASASRDVGLVGELTELINRVYAIAEEGLWRDGATRTTVSEIGELIAVGQVAVATAGDGPIVGSVHVHEVADGTDEFGMLVAAPERRSTGVGRALLDFAETASRQRGRRTMQLELLVPRQWQHPSKEFLKAWYGRRGYRLVGTTRMDDSHPQLAPLLATPCDLEIHQKPLGALR